MKWKIIGAFLGGILWIILSIMSFCMMTVGADCGILNVVINSGLGFPFFLFYAFTSSIFIIFTPIVFILVGLWFGHLIDKKVKFNRKLIGAILGGLIGFLFFSMSVLAPIIGMWIGAWIGHLIDKRSRK